MTSKKKIVGSKAISSNPFAALAAKINDLPAAESRPVVEANHAEELAKPIDFSAAAKAAKIVVSFSRKGRGGKTVTVVRGIDQADVREKLAKDLRKALGSGSSVDGEEVIVQGEQIERVIQFLETNHWTKVVRGV